MKLANCSGKIKFSNNYLAPLLGECSVTGLFGNFSQMAGFILLGYILLGYILLGYILRTRWAFFAGSRLSVEADAASVSLYFLLSVSLSFLGNILGMREMMRVVALFAGSRHGESGGWSGRGKPRWAPSSLPSSQTHPPVTRPAPTCDGEADLRNMCDRVVKVEPLQMWSRVKVQLKSGAKSVLWKLVNCEQMFLKLGYSSILWLQKPGDIEVSNFGNMCIF